MARLLHSQVLIVPFGLCWGLDCAASLAVVMGTESYDGREHKYVDYPVTDLLQMTGLASRCQHFRSCECRAKLKEGGHLRIFFDGVSRWASMVGTFLSANYLPKLDFFPSRYNPSWLKSRNVSSPVTNHLPDAFVWATDLSSTTAGERCCCVTIRREST